MFVTQFAKVKATTAAEVCTRFELQKKARALLNDRMLPHEFVQALAADEQYLAGIDFMAYALPAREGIWWGCLCLQHAYGNDLRAEDKEACKAAVQWIMRPTEQSRAAAYAPARMAGPASPAGQLAMAASQSVGSVPIHASSTITAPFTPARAVANAVKLASAKIEPVHTVNAYRLFLELGIGVAEGRFA
jgi:hypothetical protein